jgi:guanosine-3',5'-bis(diphosphate) 3'-pyrophosphohydrolase
MEYKIKDYTIQNAEELAYIWHANQYRRDGTTPYIEHIKTVVANVKKRGGTDDEIATAFAHDLIEDTEVTLAYLEAKLGPDIASAVDALTKREGETYMEAVARAKANPIARNVKIADNLANLSDSPTDRQIIKYAKSLTFLMKD